jgi:hypothetical protein
MIWIHYFFRQIFEPAQNGNKCGRDRHRIGGALRCDFLLAEKVRNANEEGSSWKVASNKTHMWGTQNTFFSRSGVEINFSDVNIVTVVEHFLPREQIFANICSLGSFHFFDSCDKNLMGVFIFFDCCDKNLIVLSRQLLIPLNSSKDDNSFVIIFLFLKFEIFVLFLLPTVKKIVYILLERMLIFPSVLCSPRASPSGYKLHLRKNHAFLSLNI